MKRHYPEIHDQVFMNLTQTSGLEVLVSVSTFLARIEALGTDGDGGAARALLTKRGLSNEVCDDVRKVLQQAEVIAPEEPVDLEVYREELEVAEGNLWAYYLEWSAVARSAINNKNYLRIMGFGS